MSEFSLRSTAEIPVEDLVRVTNDAFTAYVGGNITFNNAAFLGHAAADGVSLSLSRVVEREGEILGIAKIARLGWTSRLAMMGITQAAQGQGVGRWFMEALIDEAQKRGDRRYLLEVIQQNPRGVRLYQSAGFEITQELYGYDLHTADLDANSDTAEPEEVDVLHVGRLLTAYGPEDLPWQVAGWAIMRMGMPVRAYHLDGAYAVVQPAGPDTWLLRSVLTLPEDQGKGRAARLLRILFARHSGKWHIPAFCPASVGEGLLLKVGFQRNQDISQYEMARSL